MRRNAAETATEDAAPGLVESAAEQQVNPEVPVEQQEKLAQQQDSGAGTESGTPPADANTKNEEG